MSSSMNWGNSSKAEPSSSADMTTWPRLSPSGQEEVCGGNRLRVMGEKWWKEEMTGEEAAVGNRLVGYCEEGLETSSGGGRWGDRYKEGIRTRTFMMELGKVDSLS